MSVTSEKATSACVLTAVLALAIGATTLIPHAPGPAGIPGLDKLAHFAAFACLAAPVALRFPHLWRAAALAALAYGGTIEILQPFAGRSATWGDLLADGAGAFAGALVAARYGRRRHAASSKTVGKE